MIKITDSEVLRFLEENFQIIQEKFQPEYLILFGSRINGTPDEWSDIDLIVVSERFAEIRFVNRMAHFLIQTRPHIHVDAFCYTPQEFEKLRVGIGVVADACREGIWL